MKETSMEICPHCNGSGEGAASQPCWTCNGTGGVEAQKQTSQDCTAYPLNGCLHPQLCKDRCVGRPLLPLPEKQTRDLGSGLNLANELTAHKLETSEYKLDPLDLIDELNDEELGHAIMYFLSLSPESISKMSEALIYATIWSHENAKEQ